MIVASEVIRTGRRRTRQASATASRTAIPSSDQPGVNSTIRMLLETAMPTSITTPIRDMTLRVVPAQRVRMTPARPGGTAMRIRNGIEEGTELRDQDQVQEARRRGRGRGRSS